MTMNCPACGAENSESAEFCNLCLAGIGFENPEYTESKRVLGGYLEHYPSSFDNGAPGDAERERPLLAAPEVSSVDIGEYGESSGHEIEPRGGAVTSGGSLVGINTAPPFEAPGRAPQWTLMPEGGRQNVDRGAYPESQTLRAFDWTRAITLCVAAAAIAALLSVSLELFLSFIGYAIVLSGSFTMGMIVVFVSLLIPVVFAGFSPGYRMEKNGWALGLIAVGMWAFAFRPLYFAVLSWMLADRFSFNMIFNKFSLAFVFGLFLPLGAFLGWLGERKARTGLYF